MGMKSFEKLAIHGGSPVIRQAPRKYNPIGVEEAQAVAEVVRSGVLSQYVGCWGDDFLGGPKVREFERAWGARFGVKHAVTVNSWTSGLIAAVGALGIEPGDEVIVPPWTMCASASAILHWNAIPVFADIDPETFTIDPKSIEANITPHTRAIMAVDIFGQSADITAIMEIAERHRLKIVSDCAQAPGATHNGGLAGTLAHIGGFSLNYHKHIHAGEGGIVVTNDDQLADRVRLIRNHAEAVVGDMGVTNLVNMVGHNFRLGEIESAIGLHQLRKLDGAIESRRRIAERLINGLRGLPGLCMPRIAEGNTHVYYFIGMSVDPGELGASRDAIVSALRAEGVPVNSRYQNLHLLPLFQRKIAFGSAGFPWVDGVCRRHVDYRKGICPVAERLNDSTYLGLFNCAFEMSDSEVDLFVAAFHKVWGSLDEL